MKNMKFFLGLFLTLQSYCLWAQTGFNYQAVIRDAAFAPLASQSGKATVSIYNGSLEVYSESHDISTDPVGLFNLVIGRGTPILGDFDGVDWGSGNRFVQVLVSINGTDYNFAQTELQAVPYAKVAERTILGDPDASDDLTLASVAEGDVTGPFSNLQITDNAVGSDEIANGSITTADLGSMGANAGQVLKWNGTAWTPAANTGTLLQDADSNTKVQVEKLPNEDVIRFDLGGSENMVLRKNAAGVPRLELLNEMANTFIGQNVGQANTSGTYNTAFGKDALSSNTTGGANTACGVSALISNTTGDWNTAIGMNTLRDNTTGSSNTATGSNALRKNTSGAGNIAIGESALFSNTTGTWNTANGYQALWLNSEGVYNTAIGANALYNNIGSNNTADGVYALGFNTTGSFNTANGRSALNANTTGNWNTAVGQFALQSNTVGYGNTALGSGANVNQGDLHNASALGNAALVNANDRVVIGQNINGMVIGGYASWSNLSDGRFKEDIRDNVPGLDFINRLRPVTYWINTDKLQRHITAQMPDSIAQRYLPDTRQQALDREYTHTGFIAQEVEASARAIGYAFDGVNAPKNATDNYSIAYSQFVPSLVKAVQEQQTTIETQAAENAALKAQLDAQKAQMDAQKAQLDNQSILLQQITAAMQSAGISLEHR